MERNFVIAARVVLVACMALTGMSCHLPDCKGAEYDAGERFQLTVVGRQTTSVGPPCAFAALAPGDTLTIVAGDLTQMSNGCAVRAARPEIPSFAKELVSMCKAEANQLGQRCWGATSSTMGCALSTYVFSNIQRSDQRIDGTFNVQGSGTCAPIGSCSDRYDVHIERLPPS